MRGFLIAAALVGAMGLSIQTAKAADGCSFDYYGRLFCAPGAQPGTPYYYGPRYYGHRYDDDYEYGYRRRQYGPDPGVVIGLGLLGAATGAIAHQTYRHHRRPYRQHRKHRHRR